MNNSDDVRMVWLFLIIPVYLVSTIILSRLAFVIAATVIYTAAGISQEQALARAQEFILTIESQVMLQTIDLLVMIALVLFLVKKVEKREFSWSAIGLEWKSTSLVYFSAGILLAILLNVVSIVVSLLQETMQVRSIDTWELLSGPVLTYLTLHFAWAMLNGFWQELVFRGYLQTRCIERYGVTNGILIATVYFVLIHFLDRELNPLWVIAGIILFILLGLLYHQTESLFLVGAAHGMINYLDQVLDVLGITRTHSYDVYYFNNLIIFGLVLGLLLVANHVMKKRRLPENVR